jgi:hypothetical protein
MLAREQFGTLRDNRRMSWRLCLVLYAVTFLQAQTRSGVSQDFIVPGLRVGPITRTITELSLEQALGKNVVKAMVDIGEGMTEPGLIIYNDDPTRRLAVLWNGERLAHPATVLICYGPLDVACRWRTESGIGFGTTLKQLEVRNGKPF